MTQPLGAKMRQGSVGLGTPPSLTGSARPGQTLLPLRFWVSHGDGDMSPLHAGTWPPVPGGHRHSHIPVLHTTSSHLPCCHPSLCPCPLSPLPSPVPPAALPHRPSLPMQKKIMIMLCCIILAIILAASIGSIFA